MARSVSTVVLAAALLAEPLLGVGPARGEGPTAAAADEKQKPAEPFVLREAAPDALTLEANGADLRDVLDALGEEADFDVRMNDTLERPPVDATILEARPDEAVRRVLRRRNYALVYRAGELSEVFVLSPPRSGEEAKEIAERRRRELEKAARREEREERLRRALEQREQRQTSVQTTARQQRQTSVQATAREERRARAERAARRERRARIQKETRQLRAAVAAHQIRR